jgi:nitrile hydratase accessory protein
MSVQLFNEDLEGPLAAPRSNGELVFEEPWESDVFAVGLALEEAGVYTREEFRRQLIAEISAWEAEDLDRRPAWRYYEHWYAAVTALLRARGVVADEELHRREDALAGHDHHH